MPPQHSRQLDHDDEQQSEDKAEVQAASEGQVAGEGDEQRLPAPDEGVDAEAPGAEAQVASEPMTAAATLSRLGGKSARVPPGRQLSGEPPAV